MLFFCYPKCTTCQRARAFLDSRGAAYDLRDIKLENPTADELRGLWKKSGLPLKKFFNTSGLQYKALGLKDKLPGMTEEEAGGKALAAMGDPKELGQALAKIHKPWLGWLWQFSRLLALVALLLLAVEAIIALPVAWDLLWAGALKG